MQTARQGLVTEGDGGYEQETCLRAWRSAAPADSSVVVLKLGERRSVERASWLLQRAVGVAGACRSAAM